MATDAVTLKKLSAIYNGNTPPEWMEMKLALLAQILLVLNPMADVSAAGLLAAGAQYQPFGPQCWQLMELALLASILNGGITPSSSVQIAQYNVDPNAELVKPGNINISAIAYQASGLGPIFIWNTTTHVWA